MPAGRPRKPTKLKVLEGNRGHRKLTPEAEPEPMPGIPPTPTGMSAWGKRIWRDVTTELDRLNMLTTVDAGALEAAILGADQAHTADRAVRKFIARVNSGKASREDFYHLSVMNNVSKKGWNQYKGFCTEFGLTPASRSRLSTDSAPAKTSARAVDSIERVVCG